MTRKDPTPLVFDPHSKSAVVRVASAYMHRHACNRLRDASSRIMLVTSKYWDDPAVEVSVTPKLVRQILNPEPGSVGYSLATKEDWIYSNWILAGFIQFYNRMHVGRSMYEINERRHFKWEVTFVTTRKFDPRRSGWSVGSRVSLPEGKDRRMWAFLTGIVNETMEDPRNLETIKRHMHGVLW